MDKKKISIQKKPKENDDLSVYGFESLWNKEAIRPAIKDSKKRKEMPKFFLDKIEIHPAAKCNLHCNFCHWSKLHFKNKENLQKNILKKNVFESIRRDMPDENPLIILSGIYSEPLVHPEIINIINTIGKNQFRFGLYTNGLLMTEEIMDSILESAAKTKLNKPSYVSFNVSANVSANSFGKSLIPTIKKLAKKRKLSHQEKTLHINTPIVVAPGEHDYNTLCHIIESLQEAGVDNIRLTTSWYNPEPNKTKTQNNPTLKNLEKLEKKYSKKVKIRIRNIYNSKNFNHCFAMTSAMTIDPTGNVYPCAETANPIFSKSSYGNIYQNKISKIWKGEKHKKLFTSLNPKNNKCACCPSDNKFNKFCNSCKD